MENICDCIVLSENASDDNQQNLNEDPGEVYSVYCGTVYSVWLQSFPVGVRASVVRLIPGEQFRV